MLVDRQSDNRGKQERFFRYVLRRQPCFYILLANMVCLILFIALALIMYNAVLRLSNENSVHETEDKALREIFKGEIVFTHCPYEPRPKNWVDEWDFTLCSSNCGPSAIAHRTYKLIRGVSDDEATCQDIVETVLCSSIMSNCYAHLGYQHSCPGLMKTPLVQSIVNSDTIGPLMMKNQLEKIIGKKVFANELVVHCPRCFARSVNFRDLSNNCKRMVGTRPGGDGWPYWAKKCDVLIDEPKC